MASSGVAGRGTGSDARGEKRPSSAAASGGPAGRATPACLRCAFWRHHHHHPASNLQAPTQLRVALLDSDPATHDFVRQTLKAHANGWTLDSRHDPDSLLAALAPTSRVMDHASTTTPHEPPTTHHVSRFTPHVFLMEPHWPGLPGLQHVRKLIARLPETRFVMFTACADSATIVESLMAGALGYLVKPVAAGNLIFTISEAAQGRATLSGQAQGSLIELVCRMGGARRSSTLSWRECEVMLLLLKGATSKQISEQLGIHDGTVNRHLHDIYHKLGMHRKADALRKFVFAGGG